ncbi:MAG: hypothetical protein GTO02_10555 [Candidatus Dadabacteria bacterium]|nr:hypothetical protein [Candidatus Dadabacteria bacterium]
MKLFNKCWGCRNENKVRNPDNPTIVELINLSDKEIKNLCFNCKCEYMRLKPMLDEKRTKIIKELDDDINRRRE